MNNPTVDGRIPEDEHIKRLNQAKRRAQWELGDPGWASVIINAYLNPESDAERLKEEKNR